MLDIQFIRDNPELVKEKSRQKGFEADIDKLLGMDKSRRALTRQIEELRAERNAIDAAVKQSAGPPVAEQIERGRAVKEEIGRLESELAQTEDSFGQLLKSVPNIPTDDVPVGDSEEQNVVAKEWGAKPQFDFTPRSHWQIGEQLGLIDKQRAAKVTGSRFAYLKGELVRLQLAIMQFTIDVLSDQEHLQQIARGNRLDVSSKPFTPVLPPALIRTEVYDAMDRLEPREDRYKIEGEELWLQGSAEHTLGSMYQNELLDAGDLPIRYIGFLTSFRREAGTYGKDTEGIIRMHQFDKLEMESFTVAEDGLNEHLFMVAIQEHLMQRLGLPYRVLQKCTADIGKPNARGIDIEAWLPSQNTYRETHTADYMTDYQARRLKTRYKTKEAQTRFVHTNDATAFALGRTLVAIIENYQKADGSFALPEALQTYLGRK